MTNENRRLGRDSLLVLIINVLAIPLALVASAVISRSIGAREFGNLSYVQSWMALVQLVAVLGMDTASSRFIPAFRARGEWGLLLGFLDFSTKSVFVRSIVLAMAGIALMWAVADRVSVTLAPIVLIFCLRLPFTSLAETAMGALMGFRRVVVTSFLGSIAMPTLQTLALLGLVLFGTASPTAAHVALIFALATVFHLFVASGLLAKSTRQEDLGLDEPKMKKLYWTKTAAQFASNTGVNIVVARADVIMIGIILGTREAGYYAAATFLATITLVGQRTFLRVALPRLAAFAAVDKHDALQKLVTLTARRSAIVTVVVCVLLATGGEWLLSLYGAGFSVASGALFILVAGQTINALAGPAGILLNVTDNQGIVLRASTLAAIANVILNATLIPRYGISGAAIATASSIAGKNLILAVVVRRKLGIRSTAF